ncbi:MAG: UMP kinase [Thaumarchaeota archaeon]|nr:UMP kinase [Nitrososphaerota archaeon]
MKIVLRIGGSILGSPPDPEVVNGYSEIVSELTGEGHVLGIIVGGGPLSRKYIESARKVGLSGFHQDLIAIHTSRLNARLVAMKMGGVSSVPTSINSMMQRLARNRVAVMGGLKPGITTDTVAAILAQKWGADLMIKGSNQKGIYTADPAIDKKAKKLDAITYAKMKEILGGEHKPGIHKIVDPVAVDTLLQSRVKLIVLNGSDPKNILKAVNGVKIGTIVS